MFLFIENLKIYSQWTGTIVVTSTRTHLSLTSLGNSERHPKKHVFILPMFDLISYRGKKTTEGIFVMEKEKRPPTLS